MAKKPWNEVWNGDCVERLGEVRANTFDFALFSPPYDHVRDYEGGVNPDLLSLGRELHRTVKDGGVCAVIIADGTKDRAKTLTTFGLAVDWCRDAGWRLFESVIYSRHGRPGKWWEKRFRVDHEHILLFLKGASPNHFDKSHLAVPCRHQGVLWSGTERQTNGSLRKVDTVRVNDTKCRGTIWHYNTSNSEGNKLKCEHPATFPDLMAKDLIKCFTKRGDLVVDPMTGSGTTCVVAKQEGRRFLGIELSENYCAIANNRLRREAPSVNRRKSRCDESVPLRMAAV